MKYIITVILIIISFPSIAQKQNLEKERIGWDYKNWKQKFKSRAFCLCLVEGYQNENIKSFILENDKSYYDPIAITFFDSALNTFIKKEVVKIDLDAKNSYETVGEGAAGKQIFNHCLKFYTSKRLDSLTNATAPRWEKISNIQEEILKKIPSY